MKAKSCFTVLVAGLLTTSLLAVVFVQPVAADDEWRDECDKQTRTITPGVYGGTLSPNDRDSFRIKNMDAGDFVVVRLQTTTDIAFYDNELTQVDGEPIYSADWAPNNDVVTAGNRSFRIYTEDTGDCITLETDGNRAGEWRMAFVLDEAKSPTIESNTSVNLNAEIRKLRNQIDMLENRLAQLENATQNNTTQELHTPPLEITGTQSLKHPIQDLSIELRGVKVSS